MNTYKVLINMDKYFNSKEIYYGIFNFNKYKNLKIKLKFNKIFYGNISFSQSSTCNTVIVNIMKKETKLKAQRILYSGEENVNIFEQLYMINAFKTCFLLNVTSLYLNNFEDCYNQGIYNLISKEKGNYLNKLILWNDFNTIKNVEKFLIAFKHNKIWYKICEEEPNNTYSLLETIVEKLVYKGYIDDYIDENLSDYNVVDYCIELKLNPLLGNSLLYIRDYMFYIKHTVPSLIK